MGLQTTNSSDKIRKQNNKPTKVKTKKLNVNVISNSRNKPKHKCPDCKYESCFEAINLKHFVRAHNGQLCKLSKKAYTCKNCSYVGSERNYLKHIGDCKRRSLRKKCLAK